LPTYSPLTTENIPPATATTLLAQQRLVRPLSPHLSAYKLSQTWFTASVWHRFTGMILTGSLYAYASAYAVAPLLGWHLGTASLAAFVAGLPVAVKAAAKFVYAWPFVYHAFNGVRHLVFDLLVRGFSKPQFGSWSWVVWGGSLVGALGLAVLV
jgi:succinate dehydrogenase (ubiquinone) cytochrome b560 subunit